MNCFAHTSLSTTLKKLERPTGNSLDLFDLVSGIFSDIKENKDTALLKYIEIYDNIKLDANSLKISEKEISAAEKELSQSLKDAIQIAKSNIEKFHVEQLPKKISVETMRGVKCSRESHGIEKVGIYIPGGTAPLFSTVLMLAIPAKIADCKEVILCTPSDKDGKVNPAILYTAKLCGVNKIFGIGGIQAIAALSLGTETVPKVYKIFGPGNSYVTAAKQYANLLGTAIDMPAGPSEVMVIADEKAHPSYVAADLLSQAEHGNDSQVILLSFSEAFINDVKKSIGEFSKKLQRKNFIKNALKNSSLVYVEKKEDALEICNAYGAEHLILNLEKDLNYFKENVRNAGSVFIGALTPESAGDYASGTNHTLPTNGFAKQYSGVSTESFMRNTTYQELNKEGLKKLGAAIIEMAEAEGLDAHALAVKVRLENN